MTIIVLAMMLAASTPSVEAQRLGRKLADQGTLAALLPLMKAGQIEELLKEEPNLNPAERVKLRATADRVFAAGYELVMKATGDAYARQMGIADLRAVAKFYTTPSARKFRSATPAVIAMSMKSVGQMDFKNDVRTAFCADEKRLCPK